MNREKIPWLVKSGGRVLGPFLRVQIGELLRRKEISYLDEIASPMRRWQTIQIHPEFRDLVQQLRENTNTENTAHEFTPTDLGANTQTLTDFTTGEVTDDITSSITGDLDGFTPTQREIVINELSEQTASGYTAPAGRYQPKGMPAAVIQKRVDSGTRWMWVVTLAILIGAGVMVMNQRIQNGSEILSGDDLKKQLMEYIQVGDLQNALKALRASPSAQAGELSFYYGSLVIQMEGQTVLGRRLLAPLAASGRPEAKLALTSLGIADMVDGQWDAADQNFSKALSMDKTFEPAEVNKIQVALAKGELERTKELSFQAMRRGTNEGVVYLALAEAAERMLQSGVSIKTADIIKQLKIYLARGSDYDSEIAVHLLFLESLEGKASDEKLTEFLDRDPKLTENHRHNIFIYRGNAAWTKLAKLCPPIVGDGELTPKQNAFLASCAYRAGAFSDARAYIDKAIHQDPKDAQIQAWASLILAQTGQADQASVVLGRASELNRHGEYQLPTVLQGRFCAQKGDMDCARENWQKIYARNLDDINAIAGLASVHVANKAYGEAHKLMAKGLKNSADFIPLLKLQQSSQKERW